MPNYILTYHGEMAEMPDDPAVREQAMAAWGAWYGNIGAGLVDGGAPLAQHWGVGAKGDTDAPVGTLTGYSVISAADLDAAKTIAKGCPVLEYGSTVQISECIDMGG